MQDELSGPIQQGSGGGDETADQNPVGEVKLGFLAQASRRSILLTGLLLWAPAVISTLDDGNTSFTIG
ncbi:hypothetical protein [Micromonospora wenchangensis]|uniref:hypothetical protein n=1 Tax=Micromonospora wenchangensis TaxID=1185415 RepID=UPI0038285E64